MITEDDKHPRQKHFDLGEHAPEEGNDADSFDELTRAGHKGSIVERFHDLLVSSRGGERPLEPDADVDLGPKTTADDLAIRRAKSVSPQRMVVPEGVIIDGSMTSGSETEISGRVDGDVTVEGRLHLGATALISGNVRATSCRVEGLVEGRMECSQDLELGQTGRLNADTLAGKHMSVAGRILGNVSSGGVLRLAATSQVKGNIRAKRLVVEEGATFNGACTMRTPAQRKIS